MDVLSHAVVGAIAGEAIAGKKIGNKAPIYGSLAGVLPDIDVVFSLFMNPVDNLSIHRGFTHSIFFPFLIAPIFAYLLRRFKPDLKLTFREWFIFFAVTIMLHPLLDIMTGYGTQFFYPITRYAIELNTIFIIDPAFTLPLVAFMILLMFKNRKSKSRLLLNKTAIVYGFMYLTFTFIMKLTAVSAFQYAFEEKGIQYERMRTFPGPLVAFYWRALAETEYGYYEGYYSIFERKENIKFHFIPRNEHKIAHLKDSYALEELLWFSKGYYHISKDENGTLFFNDLRFGSYFGFLGDYSNFVFSFQLKENHPASPYRVSFEQTMQRVDISTNDLRRYFRIALGRDVD